MVHEQKQYQKSYKTSISLHYIKLKTLNWFLSLKLHIQIVFPTTESKKLLPCSETFAPTPPPPMPYITVIYHKHQCWKGQKSSLGRWQQSLSIQLLALQKHPEIVSAPIHAPTVLNTSRKDLSELFPSF